MTTGRSLSRHPIKGIFEHMAMQRRRGDWAPREMPQGIQAELDTILGIV